MEPHHLSNSQNPYYRNYVTPQKLFKVAKTRNCRGLQYNEAIELLNQKLSSLPQKPSQKIKNEVAVLFTGTVTLLLGGFSTITCFTNQIPAERTLSSCTDYDNAGACLPERDGLLDSPARLVLGGCSAALLATAGVVSAVYSFLLLREDAKNEDGEEKQLQALIQNLSCKSWLRDDDMKNLSPYLPSDGWKLMSFSQLAHCYEADSERFNCELNKNSFSRKQQSCWLLLRHFEKHRDDIEAQKKLFDKKSHQQLMREEPQLLERILKSIKKSLENPEMRDFIINLFTDEFFSQGVIPLLITPEELLILLEKISDGTLFISCVKEELEKSKKKKTIITIGDRQFFISRELQFFLMAHAKLENPQIQALSSEEFEDYIEFLNNESFSKLSQLLKCAAAFNHQRVLHNLKKEIVHFESNTDPVILWIED